jgi:hypothetical protein
LFFSKLSNEIFEWTLIRALPIYWWDVVVFISVIIAASATDAAADDDINDYDNNDDDDDDDDNKFFLEAGTYFRIADFIGYKLTFAITDPTQYVGIFVICYNHTVAVTTTTITITSPPWLVLEHVVM